MGLSKPECMGAEKNLKPTRSASSPLKECLARKSPRNNQNETDTRRIWGISGNTSKSIQQKGVIKNESTKRTT